jgi:hypothetical protein
MDLGSSYSALHTIEGEASMTTIIFVSKLFRFESLHLTSLCWNGILLLRIMF